MSTDTIKNIKDISGRPFIVNNFEVYKFYRGVDSSTFKYYQDKRGTYVISLINKCQDACGVCFKKNKMYLVYVYREFYGGHLTTDGCTRTREIFNNNFVASTAVDPDNGKDENKELERLTLSDTSNKYLFEHDNALNFQKELFKSQLEDANAKLYSKTVLIYLTISGNIIIILFLLYRLRRVKKINNARLP